MSRPCFIGAANLTEWALVLGLTQQAMSWRVARWSKDPLRKPSRRTCGVCGERGHNRRTCPSRGDR